jgi:hypothetical protein
MMKKILVAALAVAALAGCGSMVRQADLDTWPGTPVEALDMHSFFITVPMYKTLTASGIEIRNYANGIDSQSCYSGGGASRNSSGKYVNASTFTNCSSNRIVCNNLFYIKDGIVLEYAPTGQCKTSDKVRPQQRYLELGKQ